MQLSREGFKDNHKRVYRLYQQQGLSLRHKRPRRNKAAQLRQPHMQAQRIIQMWSMDFVADNLFDGRKLRMLTVLDCYTRESLQPSRPTTAASLSARSWASGPMKTASKWI